MKRLLAYLVSIFIALGAPVAQSVEFEHGHSQVHAGKVVHKAKKKARAGVKHKKKASAKKSKQVKARAKSKVKSRARKQRIVSEAQESRLHMSQNLAQAPAQVYTSLPDSHELNLRSAAVLVLDQQTGAALYAKNPDVATPIASITKLMTSMVVLDAGLAMAEEIVVDNDDVDRLKHTSSRLAVGTRLTREELMHLALIASENRAAAALSRAYPGGREAFIQAMNRKAAVLGMHNTWFVDGTGLDSSNRSTAADLAKLVNAAYNYPTIRQITSTGQYGVDMPGRRVVKVRENGRVRRVTREVMRHVAFNNTNALTRNPGWNIGVSKTGFINEAGHCLVMQANIADRQVIMVLLDSWGKLSRIGDAARVRKWLEGQYSSGRLASAAADSPV